MKLTLALSLLFAGWAVAQTIPATYPDLPNRVHNPHHAPQRHHSTAPKGRKGRP